MSQHTLIAQPSVIQTLIASYLTVEESKNAIQVHRDISDAVKSDRDIRLRRNQLQLWSLSFPEITSKNFTDSEIILRDLDVGTFAMTPSEEDAWNNARINNGKKLIPVSKELKELIDNTFPKAYIYSSRYTYGTLWFDIKHWFKEYSDSLISDGHFSAEELDSLAEPWPINEKYPFKYKEPKWIFNKYSDYETVLQCYYIIVIKASELRQQYDISENALNVSIPMLIFYLKDFKMYLKIYVSSINHIFASSIFLEMINHLTIYKKIPENLLSKKIFSIIQKADIYNPYRYEACVQLMSNKIVKYTGLSLFNFDSYNLFNNPILMKLFIESFKIDIYENYTTTLINLFRYSIENKMNGNSLVALVAIIIPKINSSQLDLAKITLITSILNVTRKELLFKKIHNNLSIVQLKKIYKNILELEVLVKIDSFQKHPFELMKQHYLTL